MVGSWLGDPGGTQINHGPSTPGSDLLYATKTERKACAVYTQWAWDINEDFTLTTGLRYASDEVTAEENLFRYTESLLTDNAFNALIGFNTCQPPASPALREPWLTERPLPISTHRPSRSSTSRMAALSIMAMEPTPRPIPVLRRIPLLFPSTGLPPAGRGMDLARQPRLEHHPGRHDLFRGDHGHPLRWLQPGVLQHHSSLRSEELTNYELGYKTQWLDGALQINGSFYDYKTIHTVATEIALIGGATTSVVEAPGAEIMGAEADILCSPRITSPWGVTSATRRAIHGRPFRVDPARAEQPESLFPNAVETLEENINGNQILQVPEPGGPLMPATWFPWVITGPSSCSPTTAGSTTFTSSPSSGKRKWRRRTTGSTSGQPGAATAVLGS